jgi:pyruvate,water dikinase
MTAPTSVPATSDAGRIAERIASELSVAMADPERVATLCATLATSLGPSPSPEDVERLRGLGALLRSRSDAAATPLVDLLEAAAGRCSDPWPLIEPLIAARGRRTSLRGLELARRLAEERGPTPGLREARFLAALLDEDPSPLDDDAVLTAAASLLRAARRADAGDPLVNKLLASDELPVRVLAARLLDIDAEPAPLDRAFRVLGAEAFAFLRPYLEFTRAGHLDLVHLSPEPGKTPSCLAGLRRAEAVCGEKLLREIVAELGWTCISLGFETMPLAAVRVDRAPPLHLRPEEAPLFERCAGARRGEDRILAIAHGGLPSESVADEAAPVARYRACNLAHAEALQEILDVSPLDGARVARLVGLLDRIVGDHVALFTEHTDECAILPAVWQGLRTRILEARARESDGSPLSAELTRLVLGFEDPLSVGTVSTLHGLKRYLHQQGLRLGFKLVKTVAATKRSVNVLVASAERVLGRIETIRYADFEPAAEAPEGPARIPYPVWIVALGFARQLLCGHASFPSARIFCYGNEVHYYLTYGSHPALARIDFAPPLQGGMVDLEYYGVSRYNLDAHPNRELDALRLFFRRLDFDVVIEPSTRVHARYDKERARDLGDLCSKAEALFRLAPYLMDLDWTLGDLRLAVDSREMAAEAWARSFERWGSIPLGRILSSDRLGVVVDTEPSAQGDREVLWDGCPPYRDRQTTGPLDLFFEDFRTNVEALGVEEAGFAADAPPSLGQIALERALLLPLRAAVARGELAATPGGLRRTASQLYVREPAAEAFARLLASGDDAIAASIRVARLAAPLERTLPFRTVGSVNRHDVQRARLPLRGATVGLHVLRDPRGTIRLALFSRGLVPSRRRDSPDAPWTLDADTDAAEISRLLRAAKYALTPTESTDDELHREASSLRETFARDNPAAIAPPLRGERIATGASASPGRAVGRAVLGTGGLRPEDVEGAVLIAPTLRPEDAPFLRAATGVVATGGGILSHAGLLAAEYGKPAMIVEGAWSDPAAGAPRLRLPSSTFREEEAVVAGHRVAVRRDVREHEIEIKDGDLVVVDADRGTLQLLGSEPDLLALHDGIRSLGAARRRLAQAEDAGAILALRGTMLRARHGVSAVLTRLDDPGAGRFAGHEILLGPHLSGAGGSGEKAGLLRAALGNPRIAPVVRDHLVYLGRALSRRLGDACDAAQDRIPFADSIHEILALRAEVMRLRETQRDVALALDECGIAADSVEPLGDLDIDVPVSLRLGALRARGVAAFDGDPDPDSDTLFRHRLRTLERIDALLGTTARQDPVIDRARAALGERDEKSVAQFAGRRVLPSACVGTELAPVVGWKAANLAELQRLAGPGRVPPWFVVTDAAFREALGSTLAASIAEVLRRDDLDLCAKAASIRELWDRTPIPPELVGEIAEAYTLLSESPWEAGDAPEAEPYVAVRSSAMEEDLQAAAHAGEFDTFLFVRGAAAVVDHVRRAWAGLWNERALASRRFSAVDLAPAGGGVIVQRMVRSRVAGVLQTIHVAAGVPAELVVNAGLGLGEGIVAGSVGADSITVSKDGDLEHGPLRFRYMTAEKRCQVVFDRRSGSGTVRVETSYHQRLRPALEYVELLELSGLAARLEDAFGFPLDIEFAIEGSRLRLLQVRPVPAHDATLRETLERYPLHVQEVPR